MSDILNFCRPEEVGVHPEWVIDYVNSINGIRKMCHSFLMMRGDKVFAEGYWKPFHKDHLHRMYSVSKSFVSAAIGMLCDEGKITLNDKIVDYFRDQLPEDGNVHPWIAEMTIRDMLMMASCYNKTTYYHEKENWIRTFFQSPDGPAHQPGTIFRYDTSATYTLNVLVERITGKTFLDYMKDKALREIGFSEDAWCIESPEGYTWGGSGILCTTRDLARFASLFAHGGIVGGKRYLSEQYVKEATSKQIEDLEPGVPGDACSGYGYGYFIWRARDNSFVFHGMGGQLAVIIPHKDIIFTCTSDTQGDEDGYHGIIDILFDTVINRIDSDCIENDNNAYSKLNALVSGLEVNLPAGENSSPLMEKINGVTYKLGENQMGISDFTFEFNGNAGMLTYNTDRGIKHFPLCLGRYAETVFPETHYSGKRIWTPKGEGYRCLNAAVWTAPDTLLVRTYAIDDHYGNISAVFTFKDDKVSLNMSKAAEWFFDKYTGSAEGFRA